MVSDVSTMPELAGVGAAAGMVTCWITSVS